MFVKVYTENIQPDGTKSYVEIDEIEFNYASVFPVKDDIIRRQEDNVKYIVQYRLVDVINHHLYDCGIVVKKYDLDVDIDNCK